MREGDLPGDARKAAGAEAPIDKYDAPRLFGDPARRRFHVMAKPVGSACNLACRYCFYLHKARLEGGPGTGRMTDSVLERFIQQYIRGVTAGDVVFSWQGGEPTLLGLDFFRRVVELERIHARPGQTIQNDLQTNGVLIDEAWCRFLRENRFWVGLSLDGPKALHDRFRRTREGAPTFDAVFAAARLLKRHEIPFSILTCVHRENARHPLDVYRFLRREVGATRIQFTPVVEPRDFERVGPGGRDPETLPREGDPEARPGHPDSIVTEWSVDPEDWGAFLCKTFDEWRSRDLGKALVNQFETLIVQRLGLPAQMCVYGEFCGKDAAIEHDGSLYACDHFVYPEHRIGHVREGELAETVLSRRQVLFGYAKSETLPRACRECPFLRDCWGECPKNRLLRTADGEPGLNYLCRGFKRYFAHAGPEADRIAAALQKANR